jgi:hypothetical protein
VIHQVLTEREPRRDDKTREKLAEAALASSIAERRAPMVGQADRRDPAARSRQEQPPRRQTGQEGQAGPGKNKPSKGGSNNKKRRR